MELIINDQYYGTLRSRSKWVMGGRRVLLTVADGQEDTGVLGCY